MSSHIYIMKQNDICHLIVSNNYSTTDITIFISVYVYLSMDHLDTVMSQLSSKFGWTIFN